MELKSRSALRCFLILSVALVLLTHCSSSAFAAVEQTPGTEDYLLKVKQYQLSLIGLVGTAIAIAFGMFQYWRAEQWKRAEFLAREMKTFFDDPEVKNVLTMIDWAPRRINLFHIEDIDSKKYPIVTRKLQVSGLRPHTLVVKDGSDPESEAVPESADSEQSQDASKRATYAREEVCIRDAYDRFLDYLERFSSYLQSGLLAKKGLNPFLKYWIDDIAALTTNADDAEWTCALFAYIEFYGFENVQKLFRKYGYDIKVYGKLFQKLSAVIPDAEIPRQLVEACRKAQR